MSDSFATLLTVAHQAPPSRGYWNGLPFSSPVDLPDLGIKLTSPMSPGLAGGFFTTEPPGKSCISYLYVLDHQLLIHLINIFFYSVGCLFILLMVPFAVQKLSSLMQSHLFIFAFVAFTF